ncbi:DNA repair metallo-beta-lactamase [Penicillium canariense]|uniref:DNA repair metallo-beta-lactamase n=1 Tax=Penicillium canariense TaxID=189055 RepID=A0A9W9HW35_9EURO|nr:DNA repair metallo-beta-lactamase [Penicillium canariense]KAJ5157086.1 DNA repair metallo-beta-lactamase [Penicillium canariense]
MPRRLIDRIANTNTTLACWPVLRCRVLHHHTLLHDNCSASWTWWIRIAARLAPLTKYTKRTPSLSPASTAQPGPHHVNLQREFPDIQIDYFRKSADRPPPLACFLSHVHTDHLQGLESFRAPFIYCSPATRELLLRLERFPHRINFGSGILEAREVTYRHLGKLVRPIPLNTPTEIELTPLKRIRVTLVDANHCPGSVMFLIEGDGKAILYTGDIRAENWWVNSLVRNPVLIPYTLAGKKLDNLYLDTTHLYSDGVPPETFLSKADSIAELLEKVQRFPPDTIFHLSAWTFGYEEVWVALAAALNTKVHPDPYQLRLYQSFAEAGRGIHESAAYNGFELGNTSIPGCLTNDICEARIHLCVPPCIMICRPDTVLIKPFLQRGQDGFEAPDMGSGVGSGDAYTQHEVEFPEGMTAMDLVKICHERMTDNTKQEKLTLEWRLVTDFRVRNGKLSLTKYGIMPDSNLTIDELADQLIANVLDFDDTVERVCMENLAGKPRRKVIRFPYARHSSYSELCHLIRVFKPKNIHACVVHDRDLSEGNDLVHEFFNHLLADTPGLPIGLETRKQAAQKAREVQEAKAELRKSYKKGSSPQHVIDDPDAPTELNPWPGGIPPTYEQLRAIKPGWLLLATVEQDDSVPPVQEPDQSSNSLADARPSTPDTIKEKRNEVRRAHEYLQEHADPEELQIGPLPSTCSTGKVDCSDDAESEKRGDIEGAATQGPQEPSSLHVQMPSESTLGTLDSQVSLPESAFAPSPTPEGSEELTRERLEELDAQQKKEGSSSGRRRARVAAYLAAKEDSYSAWADIPLTSAGDNHGEEEIEL